MKFSSVTKLTISLLAVLFLSCGGCGEDGEVPDDEGPTEWTPEICASDKDEDRWSNLLRGQ